MVGTRKFLSISNWWAVCWIVWLRWVATLRSCKMALKRFEYRCFSRWLKWVLRPYPSKFPNGSFCHYSNNCIHDSGNWTGRGGTRGTLHSRFKWFGTVRFWSMWISLFISRLLTSSLLMASFCWIFILLLFAGAGTIVLLLRLLPALFATGLVILGNGGGGY